MKIRPKQTSFYRGIHNWVARNLGKPKKCSICLRTGLNKYHWANIDHKYNKIKEDWIRLCPSCHKIMDINMFQNKNAVKKYPHSCKNGHIMNRDNIYLYPNGRPECVKCRKQRRKPK